MATKHGSNQKASTTAAEFRIEKLGDGKPYLARVHHESRPGHSSSEAAVIFLKAETALQSTAQSPVLLAGAGFGMAKLKVATKLRRPDINEFKNCIEIAEEWLNAFSKDAGPLALHVLFGLDIYAACHRSPASFEAVAQFVAHFDPKKRRASLVAVKRLPSSDEYGFLYSDGLPESLPKTVGIAGLGDALPLVCHEMNACNPRGIAAQDPEGPQANRRTPVIEDLSRPGLKVVFAAIHSLWPSARTFKTSMNALKEKKKVPSIAAFGTYPDDPDKASLKRVLEIAKRHTPEGWSTLELIPQSWPK